MLQFYLLIQVNLIYIFIFILSFIFFVFLDNPDTFAVIALSTIPVGYAIKFTDNAWTGSALQTNEGTLQFTVSTVIPPGTTWYYDGTTMTNIYGTWSKVQVNKNKFIILLIYYFIILLFLLNIIIIIFREVFLLLLLVIKY